MIKSICRLLSLSSYTRTALTIPDTDFAYTQIFLMRLQESCDTTSINKYFYFFQTIISIGIIHTRAYQ